MPIRSVEIVCLPCAKCGQLKSMAINTIKNIEMQSKMKIVYDLRITQNLQNVANYGLSLAQTPILLINGIVESAGSVDQGALKNKLTALHKA